MKITVKEVQELALAMAKAVEAGRKNERERAEGIIQDEQQKLRARVNQCSQALMEDAENASGVYEGQILEHVRKTLLRAATTIRDMLDDRPPPESDPDSAKRFPSMFRGGPV